jgi:hypothetical protein
MSDSLVVVFLYATQPPAVFETTRVQLIDYATDLAAHSDTLPRGNRGLDFQRAWAMLQQDKKAAHHFPDLAAARQHVQGDTRLSMHERAMILSAFDRLERHRAASAQPSTPTDPA